MDGWDFAVIEEALENLTEEFSERIEASPARVVRLLLESLTNGTTKLHFDSSNYWRGDTTYDVTLISDEASEEYLLQVGYATKSDLSWRSDVEIDFDIYINNERIGVTSPVLDTKVFGDYIYGVGIETMQEDIIAFAKLLGADFDEDDSYQYMSRSLMSYAAPTQLVGMGATAGVVTKDFDYTLYVLPFMQFLLASEFSSETENGVTRLGVTASNNAIAGLLRSIANVMEKDETLRALFDGISFGYSVYDEMLEELREAADELRKGKTKIELSLALYICGDNRLVKASFGYDVLDAGDINNVLLTADFGASASDAWTLEIYDYTHREPVWNERRQEYWGGRTSEEKVLITWEFDTVGGAYVHTFTAEEKLPQSALRSQDKYSLAFAWTPTTGVFTITATSPWSKEPESVTGVLRVENDDSFFFRLEHYDSWEVNDRWRPMCDDCEVEMEAAREAATREAMEAMQNAPAPVETEPEKYWCSNCNDYHYSVSRIGGIGDDFWSVRWDIYETYLDNCRKNCGDGEVEIREERTIFELSGKPNVGTVPQRKFRNIANLDAAFIERAVAFLEELFD
jgi:hypothetical protein